MIKKNVSIMYKYISAFPRDLERELQESNAAILKERVTPITRSNDGRIKKIYDNTEEVITKHAEELQEVMDQLDEIGETIRDENPYDTRLETIAQMMSDSYEKLHIFLPIEVFKEKKTFKYTVKTKYRILARKWAKIYENLPSVQLKTLEEEFDTVTKKIKDKEEELEEANYQIETQQELYHYKSEELSEIEQRLNITKTEIESEQNELKNMRYDQELKRKGYQEITRNLNKDLSEKQERERFLECQIKELRQEADKKARLSIQIKKMENMALELLLDTKDKIEMDERQNKEQNIIHDLSFLDGNKTVVILTEDEREDVINSIDNIFTSTGRKRKGLRVFVKKGSPTSSKYLSDISISEARHIGILLPNHENENEKGISSKDLTAFKMMLSILGDAPKANIVVETENEIAKEKIEQLINNTHPADRGRISVFSHNAVMGHVLGRTTVNPLFAPLFHHVLSFEGAEFYGIPPMDLEEALYTYS